MSDRDNMEYRSFARVERARSFAAQPMPTPTGGGGMRIGNQERQDAVESLARHCAEGRLTVDELDNRIAQVWAARTETELAGVLRDLPAARPAAPPAPTYRSWLEDGWLLVRTMPSWTVALASAAALFLVLLTVSVFLGVHHFQAHDWHRFSGP